MRKAVGDIKHGSISAEDISGLIPGESWEFNSAPLLGNGAGRMHGMFQSSEEIRIMVTAYVGE